MPPPFRPFGPGGPGRQTELTPAVASIVAAGAEQLQAIVDQGDAAAAGLIKQRDSITAQIADLRAQLVDVNQQLAAQQGPDYAAAKAALESGKMVYGDVQSATATPTPAPPQAARRAEATRAAPGRKR